MKTLIVRYSDKDTFKFIEKIEVDFRQYYSTAAIDRRSEHDQNNSKCAIFGLSK